MPPLLHRQIGIRNLPYLSGDKNIKASGQYAGKDYFNIFSFKMLYGDKGESA
jgi:hypothetical protein